MKLLVITQAVDRAHPVLGFFHRWLEQFSRHFESIEVIALQAGEYRLSPNVRVHSLGKEKGAGNPFAYALRFYKHLSKLGGKYDAVFVHMNPEYICLAGWFWKLAGIPVGLWYNHTVGSAWLKAAAPFADRIFHTSPFAYTARYARSLRMPAGIDTDAFKPRPDIARIPGSLYFQGRVAPAKRVDVILDAFEELRMKGAASRLTIVGPEDPEYAAALKEKHAESIRLGAVIFMGPQRHTDTPALFAAHAASVNLTDDGNYDKTVLESLACGTPAIVSSKAFAGAPVHAISRPDAPSLIAAFPAVQNDAVDAVRYIEEKESLTALGKAVAAAYRTLIGA